MLTLTHRYRIYPNLAQQTSLQEWMDICRVAYNYSLREIKDWCNSRESDRGDTPPGAFRGSVGLIDVRLAMNTSYLLIVLFLAK